MATIQLNLELTDEQYKDLMESSLDKVVGDEETTNALRDTIVTQMAKYLTDHPNIIDGLFHDHSEYGFKMGLNNTTKTIISKAAENAAKQLEDAVTGYMMDLAKTQDVTALLTRIFITAVLNGAVSGLDQWKSEISRDTYMNTDAIQSIAGRLGYNEYN